jgi:hypothetical protein
MRANKTTITKTMLCLITLVGVSLLAVTAAVAGEQDFTVVNKTGVEIHKLFVSPHRSDDWGDDILGKDTLPDGESLNITFSRHATAAHWDLRIEDSEGHSIEWESLDLTTISKVTLHAKSGKVWADVE